MAFIYVTGPAGSGKSRLQAEFAKRGMTAYDEDATGIGAPHDILTGKIATIPPLEERTNTWFDRHEYRVFPSVLMDLKQQAATKDVYLFGNSLKREDIATYVDSVIYLDIDDQTMRQRILAREDNDYGKTDTEFAQVLVRKKNDAVQIQAIQHQTIDASRAIDEVIDQILSSTR